MDLRCCCCQLKITGFHPALVFTAFLSEVENDVKTMPNLQDFLEYSDQADVLHKLGDFKVFAGN